MDGDDGATMMDDHDRRLQWTTDNKRASRQQHIFLHTVSLVVSFLGNPARIMAIGTLTPVVVLRIRTASSTFFRCVALFFGMLGNGLYSVETDLTKQ